MNDRFTLSRRGSPRWSRWARALLLSSACALLPLAVQAQRVALLIGNAGYQVGRLTNPPNDVREMKAALEAVGFNVEVVLDANQNEMKRAVARFGSLAQGAEVAFLYYSGHATQARGENYLIPLHATITKEADYAIEAVPANAFMVQIVDARPKAAIVVLDACRDNPYAASTKSTAKGLSRMVAPTGTMIAFATAPGDTAGDEGHYARVLAQQIRKPGAELLDVFRDTSAEVLRLTGGRQEPRISEVSINQRIYLARTHATPGPAVPPQAGPSERSGSPRVPGTTAERPPLGLSLDPKVQVEKLVARWMAAWKTADADAIVADVAEPFYFDRNLVLTKSDVRGRFQGLFAQKGDASRQVEIDSISVKTAREAAQSGRDLSKDRVFRSMNLSLDDFVVVITVRSPGRPAPEAMIVVVRRLPGAYEIAGIWD